ncbi:MAG: glucosaminidase domain-containing protein [Ruminococcus sp.]|nr:glucosaminidase domain-containing protein [Ruminococcus sp.]
MKQRLHKLVTYSLAVIMMLNVSLFFTVSSPVFALTDGQSQLIEDVGNYAHDHYGEYRILPSFVAAQAIQESASSKHSSGLSSLAREHHNYFGMTAGSSYSGDYVELQTNEHKEDGTVYTRTARFRSYSSFEDGMKGYYAFIYGNGGRYRNLIGVTDYKVACTLVKEDGWATDVIYTTNLINMIEKFDLTRFDSGIAPDNGSGSGNEQELPTNPGFVPQPPVTEVVHPSQDATTETATTTSVTIPPVTPDFDPVTLESGQHYTIPVDPADFTFKSNNIDVADVSEDGVITALGEGKALISIIDSSCNVVQLSVTVEKAAHDKPDEPVTDKLTGDINGDGALSKADGMLLSRFIAGWEGIVIDTDAADINGDGTVSKADGMILARYLAGWEGYDKYFKMNE